MTLVELALAVMGVPVLGVSLYLVALTALSWRRADTRRARIAEVAGDRPSMAPLPAFALLVPAHNEEAGIGATIRSLQAIEYPESLRRIVVIADNCTDRTASIAAACGAEVMVRVDPDRRGKGYALQAAIDSLLAEGADRWQALAIVDADTTVSPNLLRALAARLVGGEGAVQAAYLPHSAGTAPIDVITDVAFAAFHLVRSHARERLRLSCGLRGNGMAFRRDVLARVSHRAFSRTEDLEFGVLLGLAGVRVAFAGEAEVRGEMPVRSDVVAQQRTRWIGGRVAVARRYLPALAGAALRRRSWALTDLAVDLLVPPVSALVLTASAGTALAGIGVIASGRFSAAALVWTASLAALFVHVVHAAVIAGRLGSLARAGFSVPRYAVGKTAILLTALRPAEETWVRTRRQGENS